MLDGHVACHVEKAKTARARYQLIQRNMDKLSMSLDDIVKDARSAKGPPGGKGGKGGGGGGKAKNDKKGGRDRKPYDKKEKPKKEKTEPPPKKEKVPKEKKVRPPADPSPLVFVGGLPFAIEKAEIERTCAVAPHH